MIRDRLNATPLVLQMPWGVEADFIGVIDLVQMKALRWTSEDKGATYETVDIPAELAAGGADLAGDPAGDARRGRRRDPRGLPRRRGAERRADQGRHPARHHRRRTSPRSCSAPRSRTRASSPCSTRSSTTCPARWTCPSIAGTALDGETEVLRHADANEPFSALAFKIQTDQHLGKLTYIRVYSGRLDAGSPVLNSPRTARSGSARSSRCTRTSVRSAPASAAGEIVAVERSEADHHRRHPLRLEQAGDPGVDDLPGAGHLGRDRAEDQGRPGASSAPRSRSSPRRTRPSRSTTTRRPARRSSPGWASSTSRCWSTG